MVTRRRLLVLLGVVGVGGGCRSVAREGAWRAAIGRDHPLTGRVWDAPRARFVEPSALVDDLTRIRFVLLGEKHDNPDHHRLQVRVVEGLIAAGRRPAVAFEMFTSAQGPALARHLAERPRDAAGIADAVDWKASGWPDWAMYEPIARAALDAGLAILPANLSQEQVRAIRRDGVAAALDAAVVARHALSAAPPADVQVAMAEEIREAHCGHAPENLLTGMIAVQRARDAWMAEALTGAPGGDGAVLIGGAGHARNDRGAPAYLRRLVPGARSASVAFLEVSDKRARPEAYAGLFGGVLPFDYVWFTPAVDDADPCEKFRESLERMRR